MALSDSRPCRCLVLTAIGSLLLLPAVSAAEPSLPSGDAVIRAAVGDSEIVITTTSRVAGAIDSLTWNGKQFINSTDHGRQLQSAANFDAGSPIAAETFNPTEAGSRRDGDGATSTSRLLHLTATDNVLQTRTQMAFWLAPGEKSGKHPAKNTTALSNQLLTKRVQIGYRGLPNVLKYNVTFSLPIGERHNYAVFEVVTGYMPAEFERFWKFDADSGRLEALTDGPGEQDDPVVLATADGRYAMGCYTPDRAAENWSGPGYGRFRFAAQDVVKWNCVFRFRDRQGVPSGDYSFRTFVIVGDLKMVRGALASLQDEPTRRLR